MEARGGPRRPRPPGLAEAARAAARRRLRARCRERPDHPAEPRLGHPDARASSASRPTRSPGPSRRRAPDDLGRANAVSRSWRTWIDARSSGAAGRPSWRAPADARSRDRSPAAARVLRLAEAGGSSTADPPRPAIEAVPASPLRRHAQSRCAVPASCCPGPIVRTHSAARSWASLPALDDDRARGHRRRGRQPRVPARSGYAGGSGIRPGQPPSCPRRQGAPVRCRHRDLGASSAPRPRIGRALAVASSLPARARHPARGVASP